MINSLEDFKVYQSAMVFGEQVWRVVDKWDYFQKDTVGKQLLRSADSIAANLAEGFGRYHFKDAKNFGYYSRGSLYETRSWQDKAYSRNWIAQDQYQKLNGESEVIGRMLNAYINSIGNVSEPISDYIALTNTDTRLSNA